MDDTADGLPAEIEVRTITGGGVSYVLPRRALGPLRLIGVFFIGGGALALLGVPGAAAAVAMSGWSAFSLFWVAGAALFLVPGLGLVLVGMAVIAGHASIELARDRLIHVEHLGPLRRRWSRPVESLRRFEVRTGNVERNGRPVRDGPLAELAALVAHTRETKPFLVAIGYPRPWLTRVARDLSTRMADDALVGEITVDVIETDERDTPIGMHDGPVDQPAASRAELSTTTDGVTIVLPPTGLWKAKGGLFPFSLVWCGFMAVFTAITVLTPMLTKGWVGIQWAFVAFCAGFWAIGITLMVAGINMGRRHAIIDVVDDVLLVNRKNIFGVKSHQWPAAEIESIHVAASGIESNNVPVLELKVQTADKTHGFFSGRDEDELRWIAWLLRAQLKRRNDETTK